VSRRLLWFYLFLLICSTECVRAQAAHVVINEIMYAPKAPEPEWIELFNPTSTGIDFTNYTITDETTRPKINAVTMLPGGYLLLTRDSTALKAKYSALTLPIYQLALPSLNNGGDYVVLLDAANHIVDSLHYLPNWGGKNGASLERIFDDKPATDSTNWSSCDALAGATPGARNSITPYRYDLKLLRVAFRFHFDSLFVFIDIHNKGASDAIGASLEFYRDANQDSILQSGELLTTRPLQGISSFTGTSDTIVLPHQPYAASRYAVVINYSADEFPKDDTLFLSVPSGSSPQSVVTNEIMYAPIKPEPEWIEIFNRSNDTIDIKSWSVGDLAGNALSIASTIRVAPDSLIVLTSNDSLLRLARPHLSTRAVTYKTPLPTLNNDAGAVILKDARGQTIDSLFYDHHWGGASGASLERLDVDVPATDSTNLAETLDTTGATCGLPNSVRRRDIDLAAIQLVATPTQGDITFYITLYNRGRHLVDSATINIYADSIGRTFPLFSTIAKLGLAPHDSITLQLVEPVADYGMNYCRVIAKSIGDEIPANDTLSITCFNPVPPGGLKINEVMFQPLANSCQWIELFNTTTRPIHFFGLQYAVGDTVTTDTLYSYTIPAIELPSQSFAILAANALATNSFPMLAKSKMFDILSRTDLKLTANGNRIALRNRDSSTIDSLSFSHDWMPLTNPTGISLERISLDQQTNDKQNWNACTDPLGGTPLAINSVSETSKSIENTARVSATPNPFSPDGDGRDDLTTLEFSSATDEECYARLRILDMQGRVVRTLLDNTRFYRSGQATFDGRSDSGTALPIGLYSVLLEIKSIASGNTQSTRTAIVLAKRVR
jgi:hypothetical protein